VTHDQMPQRGAQSEQHEPLFVSRMIRVVNQQRVIIKEDRLRFLEGDGVLALILGALPLIPFEAQLGHATPIVNTL
jgi:hypothetical protein